MKPQHRCIVTSKKRLSLHFVLSRYHYSDNIIFTSYGNKTDHLNVTYLPHQIQFQKLYPYFQDAFDNRTKEMLTDQYSKQESEATNNSQLNLKTAHTQKIQNDLQRVFLSDCAPTLPEEISTAGTLNLRIDQIQMEKEARRKD